ncbi:MAG: aminopeptidase P family protein [Oscillospiraceae bacterium]|jgi:Xaa-Pro aminopeptidase|nr:aminopeptidase P family protein [Oscillospiraceae bacterium]
MTNLEKLQHAVASSGLEALLLIDPKNRFYATDFQSSAGAVVITPEDAWLFTDSRYIEAAQSASQNRYHVAQNDRAHSLGDLVQQVLKARNVTKLGGEEHSLSHDDYLSYEKAVGIPLIPAQQLIMDLRAAKSADELTRMRQAQSITDAAFTEILNFLRPGVTEQAVAARLMYEMMRRGAQRMSFDPIVVTGPRSSMPHGTPGETPLRPGDFVTMDFGCVYGGYCSDMTRTVAIGHATDEMAAVYNTVLRAQQAGIAAAKAGIPGKAVDKAGRDVIEAAGYGAYFGHGFGHSLGLDIHERPNASPTESRPMPDGCVCSAEPGVYLPGKFGVRIEDVVVFRENGCEDLTKSPKELIIV